MNKFKYIKTVIIVCLLVAAGIVSSVLLRKQEPVHKEPITDFCEIIERDTLIAVTSAGHIDYFIYRGKPMGFQLEMLDHFTKMHDLKLQIIVENNVEKAIDLLIQGKCDIIAMSLTVTGEREKLVNFTLPVSQTRQVLVQRKPEKYRQMSLRQIEDSLIRNQIDLIGKTIHVAKASPYVKRLKNLAEEIAGEIIIVEIDSIGTEEIISYVASGVFEYTVTDENLAIINQQIFPQIDVNTPISFPQNLAWAVRKESVILIDTVNYWLEEFKTKTAYRILIDRYFEHRFRHNYLRSKYYSSNTGIISDYDDLIKKYSQIIGWDWRLLASLIYHESRFDPHALSYAGAFGIMQLMPATAEELGVSIDSGVEEQIYAGVRYLRFLDARFDENISDSMTRKKLILSGYNIGFGHVLDALRLAEYYEKDINSWNDIQYYLINLANPYYYTNTEVKHGYFPGVHGVVFSNQIVERYMHYKNLIPE